MKKNPKWKLAAAEVKRLAREVIAKEYSSELNMMAKDLEVMDGLNILQASQVLSRINRYYGTVSRNKDIKDKLDKLLKTTHLMEDVEGSCCDACADTILTEAKPNVIFKRKGKGISKIKKCPPGTRLLGNKCVAQTGTQKAKEKRKGIKLKKVKRAMGMGVKRLATLKRKKTQRLVKGRSRALGGTDN